MKVIRYTPIYKLLWDSFLETSNSATFLFKRDFIEYHQTRFVDHSLLIFNEKKQLCALLPAHEKKQIIYTHQGLSYGGIILKKELHLTHVIAIFKTILYYFKTRHYTTIIYKKTPQIYKQTLDNKEDIILFRLQAKRIQQAINTVIELQHWNHHKMSTQRKRDAKKAHKAQIQCVESMAYQTFWDEILVPNLRNRHNTKPTHSLHEILYLKKCFPQNIKLIISLLNQEMIAGTVLFIHTNVVHAQYISSNETGRKTGALSLLFQHLMETSQNTHRFFSLGVSTENQGLNLNFGLHHWKEGFGGITTPHETYQISTSVQLQL